MLSYVYSIGDQTEKISLNFFDSRRGDELSSFILSSHLSDSLSSHLLEICTLLITKTLLGRFHVEKFVRAVIPFDYPHSSG